MSRGKIIKCGLACTDPYNPCGSPPTVCACALLVPVDGSLFGSYADAAAYLAASAIDCRATAEITHGTANTLSAILASNALTLASDITGPGSGGRTSVSWFTCISVNAGSSIQGAFTASSDGDGFFENQGSFAVFDCNFNELYSVNSNLPFGVSPTFAVPAAGVYIVGINVLSRPASTAFTSSVVLDTSDAFMIVNPVIAQWDDSGTTRKLEACPKLLLPTRTESSGDWYADEATAQAVLDDPLKVSNCIGYAENNPGAPFTGFNAVGGSSLAFTASGFGTAANTGLMWGSINALAGETITSTTDGVFVTLTVYDDAGNVVFDGLDSSTSITSNPLPYTGKYTISTLCAADPGTMTTLHATLTSSGTMSVNPIEAHFDCGNTCPCRLDCV